LRQLDVSSLAGRNIPPQDSATGQQHEIHEPGGNHDTKPVALAAGKPNAGAAQVRIHRDRFSAFAKATRDQFTRIFRMYWRGTVSHCVLHGLLRMQAIHSAKEISSTSGRRRSTLLRRSLQPDGGPRSSFRRSPPERLFLIDFITCPASHPERSKHKNIQRHSLFQVCAHPEDEAVTDFTAHKK
jgi:hypothetical protein